MPAPHPRPPAAYDAGIAVERVANKLPANPRFSDHPDFLLHSLQRIIELRCVTKRAAVHPMHVCARARPCLGARPATITRRGLCVGTRASRWDRNQQLLQTGARRAEEEEVGGEGSRDEHSRGYSYFYTNTMVNTVTLRSSGSGTLGMFDVLCGLYSASSLLIVETWIRIVLL